MKPRVRIVFPLYSGVTHLDFTGPHQFFSRVPAAEVIAASVGGAGVTADGLTFAGLARLEDVSACDVLCIPGGAGCIVAMEDRRYMAEIRRLAATAKYLTSVCTGSLILGAAGLLRGKRAACHWAWRELLVPFGATPDPGRIVQDGSVITGGGVTAGIDFALAVIAELWDNATAQAVQLTLEYAPNPPFTSGRPESAPREILETVNAGMAARMVERRAVVERVSAVRAQEQGA